MFTAEKKSWLTGDRVIAYVAITVLAVAVAYLYVQNNRLRSDINRLQLDVDRLLQADPPVMVGDGSIKFGHGKGPVLQTSPQDLYVVKAVRAKTLTVTSPAGATQVITLSDDWSLTNSATQGFQFLRSNVFNGEGYDAQCPQAWTKTGPLFICAVSTKLTPITLNLPNGSCTDSPPVQHTCVLGGAGDWTLRLDY